MAGEEAACDCNSSFECNFCLDVAKEPVVTACGHLFCWPCLYRWLKEQSLFCDCPVCKGEVLWGSITPIYGRGSEEEGDSTTASLDLPPRPRANRRESLRQQIQMAGDDVTQLESMIVQVIQNQRTMGGIPTPPRTISVNATPVVALPAPQQPSSTVGQLPTSSTAAAIVSEPGPSRRSRRPRRRPQ